jgi:DNA-binding transcriptional ArsR family regulator
MEKADGSARRFARRLLVRSVPVDPRGYWPVARSEGPVAVDGPVRVGGTHRLILVWSDPSPMSFLPSSGPEEDADQDGELRLLGFDDDETEAVLDAIASETARSILRAVHEEPRTKSELADRTGTSLQNVSYHLERLAEADLVGTTGTRYSEKGREMAVYGPADEPVVMFVGTDERKSSLRRLLGRFVGATALLAVLSVAVHAVVEGELPYLSFTAAADSGVADPALPLATAVFLGGVAVLVFAFAWQYWLVERGAALVRIRRASLVTGRRRERSRQAAVATAVASIVVVGGWLAVRSAGATIPSVGPLGPGPAFVSLLVGGAAVQAYDNDGLLVSWLVVFTPVALLAFGVVGIGLAGEGIDHVVGVIAYPVVVGGVGALLLGTVGFVLGAGTRRLVAAASGSV